MRKLIFLLLAVTLSQVITAQSKIFNQIVGAIRTDFSEISQNRKVIGYVRLVQLEKTSKDMYNYELQIMDENLNDISTSKFSDAYLSLNDVAFEQDVLCASFLKGTSETALYFINLEGKVIKIQNIESKRTSKGVTKNLPGIGFVYHKRAKDFSLIAYDATGKKLWEKSLEREAYFLATSPKMVGYYDFSKEKSINFINSADGKNFYSKELEVNKNFSHQFTGTQVYGDTIYYSGFISPFNVYGKGMQFKNLKKGYQKGLIVIKAWAPNKQGLKINQTNWAEADLSDITKVAGNPENKKENYLFENSVTSSDGTTYFFAENIRRKARVGLIATSVVLAPLVFITPILAVTGYNKYYYTDATIFKLTAGNRFSKISTIEQKKSKKKFAKEFVEPGTTRNIIDEEGLNPYFVGGDFDNVNITNISTKKTRYIPNNAGSISSAVYPAKEGHFMLVETNSSTKSVKLSIVPLQ